jgi:NAD(P)-dependent dehydrogenase (short-subunit alcohol dehydrogenase family)
VNTIDLTGKAAIVTGASRGLGKSMALALARAGAQVAIASPQASQLAEAAAEISAVARPNGFIAIQADITRREDCESVVRRCHEAFGGFDILINNARRLQRGPGIPADAFRLPFWQSDPRIWAEAVEVNINGTFLMSHVAAPHLIARSWGRIINISTSLDTMQRRQNSPYGVTKAAIDAETIIWAQDLEGTGVTANVLLPGGRVDTDSDPGAPGYPPDGMLPVSAMDNITVWLASPRSDGVTGQRFVGKFWNNKLLLDEAAAGCREEPVLLQPA